MKMNSLAEENFGREDAFQLLIEKQKEKIKKAERGINHDKRAE